MIPLVTLLLQDLPLVIERAKALFAKTNPGQPLPTDAEVIASYDQAFKSSIAKDEAWLHAHQP